MPQDPAYDLVVLLDPEAPEERRADLVQQIKRQIDSGGAALKGDVDWGMRKLAFEIDHRREAQYHLFQLEAAPEMLRQLDRSLSIDDSVLRHRIIRLPGEAPDVPPKLADDSMRRQSDAPGDEAPPVPEAEAEAEAPEAEAPDPEAPEAEAAPPAAEETAPAAEETAPAAEQAAPPAEEAPRETPEDDEQQA